MTIIEKCARDAAYSIMAEIRASRRVKQSDVESLVLRHFAPVTEAMEKARESIGDLRPYARYHGDARRADEALAALRIL